MVVCWKCGHGYDNKNEYCPECGAINAISTPTLEVDRIKQSDVNNAIQARIKGAGLLDGSGLIELEIGDERLVIPLETRVTFGRDFESKPGIPSVDLSRFNALDAGVSRRHATLQRNAEGQVMLMDLGSTNGTFLNQERLQLLKEYPLQDGDEIYLGSLRVILHFEKDLK